jgi:hypothetical protein
MKEEEIRRQERNKNEQQKGCILPKNIIWVYMCHNETPYYMQFNIHGYYPEI